MPQNIHEILKSWGEKARKSPARSDVLKSEVLSKLPSGTGMSAAPGRWPWLSFALTGLAALTLFFSTAKVNYTSQSLMTPLHSEVAKDQSFDNGAFSMPNPVSNLQESKSNLPWSKSAPISDDREFLKTDYYAALRTRHVQDMTARIQTIVRGMNGRVDSVSSSPSSGYLSFVIPANKLDAFKSEIRSLTRAKFYSEQTSTQNLLPQKQSIEEMQSNVEKILSGQRADREKSIADHNRTIASWQGQINAINKEVAALNAEVTDDPARQAQIAERKQQLASQKNVLQYRIYNENKDHEVRLAALDVQIKDSESQLEAIKKQDQNLLDNVATVQGSISLQWISLWGIADLYLPGPLLTWIFMATALGAYFWNRRRSQLELPI